MSGTIYHHKETAIKINGSDHSGASVCLFHSGTVAIDFRAAYGAMNLNIHTDADSLRAFAALLNEAVAALPAKVEEAA